MEATPICITLLDEIEISLYNNKKDAKSKINKTFVDFLETLGEGDHVPIIQQIRQIKNNGRLQGKSIQEIKAEYDHLKSSLKAFTISGLFNHREASQLIKHSGLLCVDFDDFETDQEATDMKKRLGADDHSFCTFYTASGNLSVIVKIDPIRHLDSYLSAERYFMGKYKLKSDPSCKDVSRLRFVTYDPNFILNIHSKPLPATESGINLPHVPAIILAGNDQFSKSVGQDRSKADFRSLLSKILHDKIDITTGYKEWFGIGLAIAYNFPEDGAELFHSISQFNEEYSYQVTEDQYQAIKSDIAVNPSRGTKSGLPTIFHIASNFGIDLRTLGAIRVNSPISPPQDAPKHSDILRKLLSSLSQVDFETQAFPQVEPIKIEIKQLELAVREPDGSFKELLPQVSHDMSKLKDLAEDLKKLKLKEKHYIMLSVENVIRAADANEWGLCKNKLFIYLYNGEFWSIIEREIIEKFLSEAAVKMGVARFSAEHFEFAAKLYKQFAFAGYLPTPEPAPGEVLVNLKNGTYEVTKEIKLRSFDRADFLTYQLPFVYDSQATAPIFEAYLSKVLPDESSRMVLAEYLGYVFSDLKLEKALILYGSGANGKSVFFEIVNSLFGKENITHSSLQSLTNENGYSRATIANKLVNYATEINGKLETSIFKQLVSGEPIEARLPFGDPFTITKYAKLIFNCNELPKEVEHTTGYFRRFLIIPFNITIPEDEQDKELHKKIIAAELSGVFNWVLEGLKRIIVNKRFTDCNAAKLASSSYERDSDSVRLFLDENRYIKGTGKFLIQDLYAGYTSFCNAGGAKSLSRINFTKRLTTAGITVKKYNTGMTALLIVDTSPLVDEDETQESSFTRGSKVTKSDEVTKVTTKVNNEMFSLLKGYEPESAVIW